MGKSIVVKPIEGFNKNLYFEKSQHLIFLFQNKISYEINIWNNVKSHINEGDLVFDVGGNIGQYAMRFSEVVGDKGKVLSFEPDFKNFAFLQFNANMNACKNLQCLNIGLAEEQKRIEFFRDTETGGRAGSFQREFVKEHFKGFTDWVEVDVLDNVISKFGMPNFVKIDVEGFEYNVIRGIKTFQKKTKFLIEVRESTKNDVFDVFAKNNFRCWVVDSKIPFEVRDKKDIPSFANLLFLFE